MKTRLFYPIKEIFLTLQGEGAHAGARAVFVRTSGCNVWSGREQDRERDTKKGCCAAWCDTDFNGTNGVNGGKLSALQIRDTVVKLWGEREQAPMVVISGGEPGLVIDDTLVLTLQNIGADVHVETNGSQQLPDVDWVTLSPKPPMGVKLNMLAINELKCIYPAGFDPLTYASPLPLSIPRFIQPLDSKDPVTNAANAEACIEFVHRNPEWRLSTQLHKTLGLQ
jgi:7-carboxy-7-deazaguanine synthase (Cx14CxxC type)